jgi:hypothetical protein
VPAAWLAEAGQYFDVDKRHEFCDNASDILATKIRGNLGVI